MVEGVLQLGARLVEYLELSIGERVEIILVRADKVGENRTWYYSLLLLQR